MINIQFTLNENALKRYAQKDLENMINFAKNRKNKTFQISTNGTTHKIRYEIGQDDYVSLFVHIPDASEASLVQPTLRLNIGDILLPESMSIGKKIYNDIPVPVPYKTVGYNELPDSELQKIFKKIREIGFFNLIKN